MQLAEGWGGARSKRIAALIVALILASQFWPGPAGSHDRYTGLKSPNGVTCCGGFDCAVYPAESVKEVRGGWQLEDGMFVRYEDAQPSFDGDYHICIWGTHKPACFLVPANG